MKAEVVVVALLGFPIRSCLSVHIFMQILGMAIVLRQLAGSRAIVVIASLNDRAHTKGGRATTCPSKIGS